MSKNPRRDIDRPPASTETADHAVAAESAGQADPSAGGHDDRPTSSEVEQLRTALAESEKRVMMAAADLENYRKRASKAALDQVKYASLPLMVDLLESVDNLYRAWESTEDNPTNASIKDGVKMVADQIIQILQANHCTRIDAVGQAFDPNLHEAVQMQPSDEYPANTVMRELRPGYVLHDRVVRPAQVFVSTGPAVRTDQARH